MVVNFDTRRSKLENQFSAPQWIVDSGRSAQELEAAVFEMEKSTLPRSIVKANEFDLIARQGRIAVDREDIFQDKLDGVGILRRQRIRWARQVQEEFLPEETREMDCAWGELGAYLGNGDYSHVSPNSRLLMQIGFCGLLNRVEQAAAREGLTTKQQEFYQSCRIVLKAVMAVGERLADAIKPYNEENSAALLQVVRGTPRNTYEAMQLLVLYFFMHDYISGARIRTLGRLDVLLEPFYNHDIANGTYTKEDIKQMLKFFLHKFWSAKVMYDLPFCLGGHGRRWERGHK